MKSSLEFRLFVYALLLAIGYQVYQCIAAIFILGFHLTTAVSAGILLAFVLIYVNRREEQLQPLAFLLHLTSLSGFSYFWVSYGGLHGTVASFLSVYIAFILAVSKNVYLAISLSLFVILFGLFIFYPSALPLPFTGAEMVSPVQRDIDYMVVAVIFIIFFSVLKNEYRYYRKELRRKNKQLKQLVLTLSEQNAELKDREQKIEMINNNLEGLIQEHTEEIKKKNEELSEYAFINAHLVRAPLCRIMGLTDLITRQQQAAAPDEIREMRSIAGEIDGIVREINAKLN